MDVVVVERVLVGSSFLSSPTPYFPPTVTISYPMTRQSVHHQPHDWKVAKRWKIELVVKALVGYRNLDILGSRGYS